MMIIIVIMIIYLSLYIYLSLSVYVYIYIYIYIYNGMLPALPRCRDVAQRQEVLRGSSPSFPYTPTRNLPIRIYLGIYLRILP